jgi:hypothetical protein
MTQEINWDELKKKVEEDTGTIEDLNEEIDDDFIEP